MIDSNSMHQCPATILNCFLNCQAEAAVRTLAEQGYP
jgi:hypothetical protein